jgi:hypothetical protein
MDNDLAEQLARARHNAAALSARLTALQAECQNAHLAYVKWLGVVEYLESLASPAEAPAVVNGEDALRPEQPGEPEP